MIRILKKRIHLNCCLLSENEITNAFGSLTVDLSRAKFVKWNSTRQLETIVASKILPIVFVPLWNRKLLSRAQFSLNCDVKLLTRLLLFSRKVFHHNSIQFDEFLPNLSKLWNPLNPLILIFFYPLRFFIKSVYKIFSRDVGKFLMDFFRFEYGEGWRRTFFLFTWPDKKKVSLELKEWIEIEGWRVSSLENSFKLD